MLLSLLSRLVLWDKWLFSKINSSWINPVFDLILPYMRDSNCWMPLYLFLFVFVVINFKSRGWWWILFFVCTVAMTDMTSSRPIKEEFERLRPCADPDFYFQVRLLVKQCSGGYSFTSSHAANHFGMATFFFLTFRNFFKKWAWIAFLWAGIIAYSQVYVGVHYPLDVAGGAVIGILGGGLTGMIFNKRFVFVTFDQQPTV